jgi:hypothetical protein
MPGIKLITPEGKAKIIIHIRDFSVKFARDGILEQPL